MAEGPRAESVAGMEDLPLEQLRELVLRGDQFARDTLWLRLEPILRLTAECAAFRYARSVTTNAKYAAKGMSRLELIDDALLDVFEALPRHLEKAKTVEPYLKSAAWSSVIDRVRRHLKDQKVLGDAHIQHVDESGDDSGIDAIEGSVSTAPTPEQMLLDAEDAALKEALEQMLRQALDIVATSTRLGPRRIAALRMQFFESKAVDDIAATLELPKRTAEHTLTRAREDVEQVLRDRFGVQDPAAFFSRGDRDGK
jgi:RNA polymerase sigma factor (sigma-70 family)